MGAKGGATCTPKAFPFSCPREDTSRPKNNPFCPFVDSSLTPPSFPWKLSISYSPSEALLVAKWYAVHIMNCFIKANCIFGFTQLNFVLSPDEPRSLCNTEEWRGLTQTGLLISHLHELGATRHPGQMKWFKAMLSKKQIQTW